MNLKEYFLKKRIDPDEFAVAANVSASTIYRQLRGVGRMSMKTARKIELTTNGEVTVEELRDK